MVCLKYSNFGIQCTSITSQLVGLTGFDLISYVNKDSHLFWFTTLILPLFPTSPKKQLKFASSYIKVWCYIVLLPNQEIIQLQQLLTKFGIQKIVRLSKRANNKYA